MTDPDRLREDVASVEACIAEIAELEADRAA